MIFVTVGTWRFDKLVEAIDRAVGEGRIDRPVLLQIAHGLYVPSHCRYFRQAPSLAPYYQEAELVVAHGGTGTTLEVLERRLPLISVANPDVQDNHQDEFLEALEHVGYVTYCRDLTTLPDLIQRALLDSSPRCLRGRLWMGVSKAVDAFGDSRAETAGPVGRWCARRLREKHAAHELVSIERKIREETAEPAVPHTGACQPEPVGAATNDARVGAPSAGAISPLGR
jgi:beta-1,4-N-acetylglucosaminyltransferase